MNRRDFLKTAAAAAAAVSAPALAKTPVAEHRLDVFPGAEKAYSTRQIRSGYTGPLFRVRRSSDNAEMDIGFSGNALDTTSLESHCGAGDGFVVTWYDQSGNHRIEQTASKQPVFTIPR